MIALKHVPNDAVILGWDFSTGGVKCLAFRPTGEVAAEVRFPNDLVTTGGVSELNLFQLEGQARGSVRAMAASLKGVTWLAGGISATHHTAGRIDANHNPVRRAICWNDQTLAEYHTEGLKHLGGMERVKDLIGGPWAERYSLSHLVKDLHTLTQRDWLRTQWILPHGPLAAGYLTGRFDCISVSSAASTGLMDLRTNQWRREMLHALHDAQCRELAWRNLPSIMPGDEPIAPLSAEFGTQQPLFFPTLDDQAAGLVGGGATDAGHVAIILGNSAVVNSSAGTAPKNGSTLDAMKLNWGPYLWMRCYSNGAQFLDGVVGPKPDWAILEAEAANVAPRCNGVCVLPFTLSEPSIGVTKPNVQWTGTPTSMAVKTRAAFEAIAYLIGLAVKEHEAAGQVISRVSVSGGIARSDLMLEILASVLNKPLERLASDEGPALGAAVAALWGYESHMRKTTNDTEAYTITDAVTQMVRFAEPVQPNAAWVEPYREGLEAFRKLLPR